MLVGAILVGALLGFGGLWCGLVIALARREVRHLREVAESQRRALVVIRDRVRAWDDRNRRELDRLDELGIRHAGELRYDVGAVEDRQGQLVALAQIAQEELDRGPQHR